VLGANSEANSRGAAPVARQSPRGITARYSLHAYAHAPA
jgi:hypothetical protein